MRREILSVFSLGDEVTIEVDGVGILTNPVVEEALVNKKQKKEGQT